MIATVVVPVALLGATALYLLFVWLASAIVAAYLSDRKGYTQRPGLAAGLVLFVLGPVLFLVIPAKKDSAWKRFGPFGSTMKRSA